MEKIELSSKLKALISLLDDLDANVYNQVKDELLRSSNSISELQIAFEELENSLQKDRLAQILDQLKIENLTKKIDEWLSKENPDLLDGLMEIVYYGNPNEDRYEIEKFIDSLVEEVKLNLVPGMTDLEIVHLLNQVILYDNGFKGNYKKYNNKDNSFINLVIKNKRGNPIGLSIMYLLVAKKLNLPLVGINSPGHFILGVYKTDYKDLELSDLEMFFDPFNNGKIIQKHDFLKWLKGRLNSTNEDILADNKIIVRRVLNNLIYALFTSGEKKTAEELLTIIDNIDRKKEEENEIN